MQNPINEFIYQNNVKRQINLNRHRNGFVSRLGEELKKSDKDSVRSVISAISLLSQKDLQRVSSTGEMDTERVKSFYRSLNAFSKQSEKILNDFIDRELSDLVKDEYDYQSSLIKSAYSDVGFNSPSLKNVSKQKLESYRNNQISVLKTQSEHVSEWAIRRRSKILSHIRLRLRRQESLDIREIEKSLIGTEKRFFGFCKNTHLGAIIVAEAMHSAATSAASKALREENENINIDFIWSSILDTGSSGDCLMRNNKLVYKDLNGEMPATHFRCRTRLIPIIGNDVPPQKQSISSWFSSLSDEEKIGLIGKRRFEAYKSKKDIKFPQDFFSDFGDFYTLDVLKQSGVLST